VRESPAHRGDSDTSSNRGIQPAVTEDEFLKRMIITIDGPSGSGKTTTAMLVAKRLGLVHIDTGAMYRAVTLLALQRKLDLNDGEMLGAIAVESKIEFVGEDAKRVILNGTDVTRDIRNQDVTRYVSLVSSHPEVRSVMVYLQRRMADAGGVVLEGRDIGSVVLPHATVKVYLIASIETRAGRRHRELQQSGINRRREEIREEIERRDRFDSTREMSPLKRPVGAFTVDTTHLSINGQVDRVLGFARTEARRLSELTAKETDRGNPLKIRFHFRTGQFLLRAASRFLFGLAIDRQDTTVFHENYIFACNHLSYADPPLVGSTLGRELYFMAKRELFDSGPFAWLIRRYNAIPVRRDSFDAEAMDAAIELLKDGKSMLMFPEGTRQRTGTLGKAKGGVGYLAINAGVPTVPVYVEGSNRLKAAFFRKAPLRIVIGRPIRIPPQNLSQYRGNESYRAYGEMVMEAIAALKEFAGAESGTGPLA
jgi:cytidylate kinase